VIQCQLLYLRLRVNIDKSTLQEKSEDIIIEAISRINDRNNTGLKTVTDPEHQRTSNCHVVRKIQIMLPTHNQLSVQLPSCNPFVSRHHVRFELEQILTVLQNETELVDVHLPSTPLIVLMLQYLC
jgi:hypothetical protein